MPPNEQLVTTQRIRLTMWTYWPKFIPLKLHIFYWIDCTPFRVYAGKRKLGAAEYLYCSCVNFYFIRIEIVNINTYIILIAIKEA